MRAARLMAVGDFRVVRVPAPEPGPGEILVRIEAAGICGTDRHLFHGEFPCTPPVTLGHEFSGIVEAVGPGVAGPALGDRVTCDPNIACGTCTFCHEGRVNLCERLVAIGVHRDGGFAELAAIPAHRAFPLPAGLHPHHGAFCEPLACCLHGMDLAAIRPGERVAVIGGGVIGLLVVQLAALAGAEVMLVTRSIEKQALGRDFGAKAAASPDAALGLWPAGADAVIECAGVSETVRDAPRLARRGGRVVILGVLAKGAMVGIEPFDLLFREVRLIPSFINPFTHARAAALIASGRIAVQPLISRTIGIGELPAAVANPPQPGEVKVLAVPD
ncbi:MAG: zinc-dependent alcohol dehydrogenase family protein [Paracoccaceae bacterium]